MFVILEYCRYGNLKTFLKDQSHEFASKINNDDSDTEAIPEEKIIPRWSKTLNITSCANEKWDVLNKSINNRCSVITYSEYLLNGSVRKYHEVI